MKNKICNNASNDAIDKAIKKIRKRDKRRKSSSKHHHFLKTTFYETLSPNSNIFNNFFYFNLFDFSFILP